LDKRYWKRAGFCDDPFMLAVEDFHDVRSLGYMPAGIISYLYGAAIPLRSGKMHVQTKTHHTNGGKLIPSGFFYMKEAENISAVLFSNAGSFAKFNRMGQQRWPAANIRMNRLCVLGDPGPAGIKSSVRTVGDQPQECWGDEIIVCHNPNALHPLPPTLFDGHAHCHVSDGGEVIFWTPFDFVLMTETFVLEFV
jgi:hypothetical protein